MRPIATAVCTLALLLSFAAAASAAPDPDEKTVVSDIQYRIVYSQEIPGNCGVFAFSQWQASEYRGWEAQEVAIKVVGATQPTSLPVSPAPDYDDKLTYGGVVVAPPTGSHWVLIGDASFRAGPPPAEADCQAMLGRVQATVPDRKVTTTFRRTSACSARFGKLTAAKRAVKGAKGRKAVKEAKRRRAKASKAFAAGCSA